MRQYLSRYIAVEYNTITLHAIEYNTKGWKLKLCSNYELRKCTHYLALPVKIWVCHSGLFEETILRNKESVMYRYAFFVDTLRYCSKSSIYKPILRPIFDKMFVIYTVYVRAYNAGVVVFRCAWVYQSIYLYSLRLLHWHLGREAIPNNIFNPSHEYTENW